jgi:hypothetical protein
MSAARRATSPRSPDSSVRAARTRAQMKIELGRRADPLAGQFVARKQIVSEEIDEDANFG